jgi:hypothetical protein
MRARRKGRTTQRVRQGELEGNPTGRKKLEENI